MNAAPATVDVKVKFDTTSSRRTLMHRGRHVELDDDGEGTLEVTPGEFDLILFAYEGPPGTKATITLTCPDGFELEISRHPIEDEIPDGMQVSGDNRFFRVVPAAGSAAKETP